MLKAAILGYGGIARSHRSGYELLAKQQAPVKLVALCDIDPKQFEKEVTINQGNGQESDISQYHTYTSLDEMLEKEELDVIDICLPTYLHAEYAIKLLRLGYNVQCEKPMGLSSALCDKMLAAARESGKKLMIGMCLRFDHMYTVLKDAIDQNTYGKVTSAFFERLSSTPRWGYDGWFQDYDRSGGVALDMHIHDVDMVRYLFGEPKAVSALVSDARLKCSAIHSTFAYDDMIVTAIGDWGKAKGFPFTMGYSVNFERATIVLNKGVVTVYPDDAEPFEAPLDPDGKGNHRMAAEIEYFARSILGEIENTRNQPADAANTVRLIETLKKSAENGGKWMEE